MCGQGLESTLDIWTVTGWMVIKQGTAVSDNVVGIQSEFQ